MNNLESILINNLEAQRIPINQIESSCCPATDSIMPVLDFDEIKKVFCSNRGIGLPWQLKSADCLHLDTAKRAVCFIEMKDTDDYFFYAPAYPTAQASRDAFDKWLRKKTKELKIKLIDSIFILTAAAGKYSSGTNDVSELLDKNDVKISYIILTNMTQGDYLLYSISSLESKIRYPLISGEFHQAVTVITSEFDTHIATKL